MNISGNSAVQRASEWLILNMKVIYSVFLYLFFHQVCLFVDNLARANNLSNNEVTEGDDSFFIIRLQQEVVKDSAACPKRRSTCPDQNKEKRAHYPSISFATLASG